VSLAQTDLSTRQIRELSQYINHDLEIKSKTINCLQTEKVGRDEHNVAKEITASEYDSLFTLYQ
jgi:hypothetical protein